MVDSAPHMVHDAPMITEVNMATINVRKEASKLYIDFRYKGVRCREQTRMSDTVQNRRRLKRLVNRIDAEITLNTFNYSDVFPDSKKATFFSDSKASKESSVTFKDFANTWLKEMRPTWRVSYFKTVSYLLETKLIKMFGSKHMENISKADVLQYRSELCLSNEDNNRGLSARYVNRIISLMLSIVAEASNRFNFPNHCSDITPLRTRKKRPDPFMIHEVESITNACPTEFKNYFIVRFFSGLRTGELHGLRWKNVCFKSRSINVRESIVDGVIEKTKSTYSDRILEMSDQVHDALMRIFKDAENSEYVFSRNGKPLTQSYITQCVWYPVLKQLNIPRRRPYTSRHTAASIWLASGENPEWIARQLGHKSSEVLFNYYSNYIPNLTRSDGQQANKFLNKIEVNL
jgi:integrase